MMSSLHPLIAGLFPELILLVGGVVILLLGLTGSRRGPAVPVWVAFLAIGGAMCAVWQGMEPGSEIRETSSLISDSLVWYARIVTLTMGVLIILVARHVPQRGEQPEFFSMILFSLAGVSLAAVANNVILLFLALELVSVPTYVLIGLSRRDIRAQEATAKYFFLGAFAAAIMLYGFSFLYGVSGTMTLFGKGDSLAATLSAPSAMTDSLVLLGLCLVLAGLAFKIAAVPFHSYVADVYQGAASPVTGMLGFVPKFAGFLAIIRVLSLCGWRYGDGLFWMLWAMAALTMLVGNTLALMQHNVKRMLAYSSIAHSGYMLIAILAGPMMGSVAGSTSPTSPLRNGLTAMLFYMTVYGVMNLGAFAALSFFRTQSQDGDDSVETLDHLAGSARRHPWATLALAICVLGLMGFPLTGGFLGKVYVFSAALSVGEATGRQPAMLALVVFGVINAAIAAAYYLRILSACYMRSPSDRVSSSPCGALRLSLAICAIIVLGLFFRPSILFEQSSFAGNNIKTAPAQSVLSQSTDSAEVSVLSGL